MGAIGRDMEVLGRRMSAAAHKAREKMRGLLGRAVASGAAQPL